MRTVFFLFRTCCLFKAVSAVECDGDASCVTGQDAATLLQSRIEMHGVGAVDRVPAWSQEAVLGEDGSHKCDNVHMAHAEFLGGGSAPLMCLRDYPDMVSDRMKGGAPWDDCPQLATLWSSLPDRSAQFGSADSKVYVDVGANIGACLLPMAARPDVMSALAFEPSPANLFYLTSSLLANPETKKKVTLYPVALGSKTMTKPIYQEPGNAGNSVVGGHAGNAVVSKGQIEIHELDDIVMKDAKPPYIHLLKMDAQGYEVKILQGASKLFASGAVNAVKFELATEWLTKQGTSMAEYINKYIGYGYKIVANDASMVLLKQSALHAVACGPSIVKDFLAIRIQKGEAAVQKPIAC